MIKVYFYRIVMYTADCFIITSAYSYSFWYSDLKKKCIFCGTLVLFLFPPTTIVLSWDKQVKRRPQGSKTFYAPTSDDAGSVRMCVRTYVCTYMILLDSG